MAGPSMHWWPGARVPAWWQSLVVSHVRFWSFLEKCSANLCLPSSHLAIISDDASEEGLADVRLL